MDDIIGVWAGAATAHFVRRVLGASYQWLARFGLLVRCAF